MIDVIIADDHAYIRSGLIRIIEKTKDIRVVGEAEDGAGLLRTLERQGCDLVLMDISMPGMDVFDLIHAVKNRFPGIPILILTLHPEDQYAARTIRAGVSSYLTKSSNPNELIVAIRSIAKGKTYISQQTADQMIGRADTRFSDTPHQKLSNREYQVFCLLASGRTVSEIARELNLSVKTISTHRANILEKMDMANNAQLIYYAIQRRLI